MDETFAPEGGSLGRRDRSEVVLLPRLRAALQRLNPDQPPEAIGAAIEELSRNRSAGDFQERCHSWSAFQAAWIDGSA